MLDYSVFGFLPKWAPKEVILIVLFGISLMFCMISAILDESDSVIQSVLTSKTLSLRLMVSVNLSYIHVPL